MKPDPHQIVVNDGLAQLNERAWCGIYGPIKEPITEAMAEKIRLAQEAALAMVPPFHVYTRVAYEMLKAAEAYSPPKLPGGVAEGIAVPGK